MPPNPDPMDLPLTLRRQLLGGAGGLLAGAMLAPGLGLADASAAATAPGPEDDWMKDPQKRYENWLRTIGDLSGRVSPQWWRGVYMGIVPGHQPKILFRLESCEMKRLVRRGARECDLQYRIFTSFNDPETNEPLSGKRWRNPFTSEEVVVEPNIGSADTVARLTDRGITETKANSGFEGVVRLVWAAQDNTVLMAGKKDKPENTPAPTEEYVTHWMDRRAARKFDAPRLEMSFNSTFMSGFRKFLGMPPDQGLSVWHASGIKAKSVEALPGTYLQELWKHRPELRDWVRAGG